MEDLDAFCERAPRRCIHREDDCEAAAVELVSVVHRNHYLVFGWVQCDTANGVANVRAIIGTIGLHPALEDGGASYVCAYDDPSILVASSRYERGLLDTTCRDDDLAIGGGRNSVKVQGARG